MILDSILNQLLTPFNSTTITIRFNDFKDETFQDLFTPNNMDITKDLTKEGNRFSDARAIYMNGIGEMVVC